MKRYIFIVVGCLLLSQKCLFAFNFNSNIHYGKSSDSADVLTQDYSFVHSYRPTDKINLNGSFKYNKTKQSTRTVEMLTPTLAVDIINDIFKINMSGTQSETHDTKNSDISSKNLNMNFSSFYKKIIDTRIYLSQSSVSDDSSPKKIDIKSNSFGLKLQRNIFKKLNLSYDYRKDINKNKVTFGKNITTNDTFIATLNNIKYKYKKIKFKFYSIFSYRRSIMKSKIINNGYAKFPVYVNVQWDPALSGNVLLGNQTIIIDLKSQSIDSIYLYTNGIYYEQISSDVKWDIFWSNDKNALPANWQNIASNVSLPYKFSNTFSKGGYIKLVVVTLPPTQIILTNPLIECYIMKNSGSSYAKYMSQGRDFRSDMSLTYKPSKEMKMRYIFNFSRNNPDPGDKIDTFYNTFNLNWKKYNFTTSENLKIKESSEDTKNISFSFSTNQNIIETIDFSGAFTHSINEEGGKKINVSDATSISINAELYPDLILRWSNSLNINQSFQSNTTTKTYSSNIALTARFTKKFTFTTDYKFNKSFGSSNSIEQYLTLNSSWRISEFLYLNGTETINLPDEGASNITHNLTTWCAVTNRIHINLSYTGTRGETTIDTYSGLASWKVSHNISTKLSYNETISEGEKQWNLMLNLNVSF